MQFEIPVILVDASIRSLCVALAAWITLRLFRVRDGAQRHAVWTVVLCAMLLMPLLAAVLPALRLRVLPVRPATPAALLVPVSATPVVVATAPSLSESAPALPVVAIVYGLVALAMFSHLTVGWILSRRLLRRSLIFEDARAHGIVADLVRDQRMPALRESSLLAVPVTFGWLDAVVLLPDVWRSWDDGKLRAVLAHELAHVRRRDALVALIAAVNRCVFWFHPLSWWLARHLAALAEQVSDDSAILATGDRHKYAQVLVEIAGAIGAGNRRLLTSGLAMARTAQVNRRVERILSLRHEAARGARWLLVAIALPLVYAAAAVQFAPGQSPPPPPRPAVRGQLPIQSDLDLLGLASRTSADDVGRLEQDLNQRPDDIAARARLIAHYTLRGRRQQRLEHIFWLIENRPDAEVFDSRVCHMGPDEGLGNDSASYERATAMWIGQAARHATNARVQVNAAGAIQSTDPIRAEAFLERARTLEPQNLVWTERLAALYVAGIADMPGSFFASKARIVLDSSNDASLVGAAGDRLLPLDATIMKSRSSEDVQLGLRLLNKAQSLAPENMRWAFAMMRLAASARSEQRGPGAPPPPPPPPPPAVVPVMHVQPEYPPLARQARIQGAVIFTAAIGTDGRVARLRLVSGHPLLVSEAQAAVQQWVFPPSPAEVTTTVEVPFWLDQTATLGGTLYIRAEYPPLARQARIQGTVRLKAVMGPDGSITNLEVVSGHPLLIPAAQKAVREGVYPTFQVGPIVIEVPFRLDTP